MSSLINSRKKRENVGIAAEMVFGLLQQLRGAPLETGYCGNSGKTMYPLEKHREDIWTHLYNILTTYSATQRRMELFPVQST